LSVGKDQEGTRKVIEEQKHLIKIEYYTISIKQERAGGNMLIHERNEEPRPEVLHFFLSLDLTFL
jgi:hypothetical protein